jgi:hypothetical protein
MKDRLSFLRELSAAPVQAGDVILVPDPRFTFEIMETPALSVFFHWPRYIAEATARSTYGAVFSTVAPSGDVAVGPRVSRGMILYTDPSAAREGAAVLAPWLVDALIADPEVPTIERREMPVLGDEVLWGLSGTMTASGGGSVHRADVGWRHGDVVAFTVAFGDEEVVRTCAEAASQLDASIG